MNATISLQRSAAAAPAPISASNTAALLDLAARRGYDSLVIEGAAAPVCNIILMMADDSAPVLDVWDLLPASDTSNAPIVLILKDAKGLTLISHGVELPASVGAILDAVTQTHQRLQAAQTAA